MLISNRNPSSTSFFSFLPRSLHVLSLAIVATIDFLLGGGGGGRLFFNWLLLFDNQNVKSLSYQIDNALIPFARFQ